MPFDETFEPVLPSNRETWETVKEKSDRIKVVLQERVKRTFF